MKGDFYGVITHPEVKIPEFRVKSQYNTVRYGYLDNFVLLVPPNSKVERVDEGRTSYFLVITPNGEKYGFGVWEGDAYDPSTGWIVSVEKIEEKIKEKNIIREARAVWI